MSLVIVGAGLAGLIAAHAWPQARVIESSTQPKSEHKALLRFRTDAVAKLTGLDFRRVTVRKGIWLDGEFVPPSIRAANMYAQKVTGALTGDRSVWNLDPVERYIASENVYDELAANVQSRITWGQEFDFKVLNGHRSKAPVINTAPLPIVLRQLAVSDHSALFRRAPIAVHRYRVSGADVFQTIYFPWPYISMYRASITGSLLIIEAMAQEDMWTKRFSDPTEMLAIACEAFGIQPRDCASVDTVEQKYGKIIPLEDAMRRRVLHDLTTQHGIFSLGRFATWRNILLDDVVQDIAVLRRLMKASNYERAIFATT